MRLIGQDKLISYIDSLTLDTLPRSVILTGLSGSGKHSLIEYIGDKFKLHTQEISGALTYDTIEAINMSVCPAIYTIDSKNISIKDQNTILKFLEEPLKNAFIVILCEDKNRLLPTIVNRCICWELEVYTVDSLKQFVKSDYADQELLLKIAKTPGQVILMQQYDIKSMVDFAEKIFTKIDIASLSNTLCITDKVSFKEEKEKFNFDLFCTIINYVVAQLVRSSTDLRYIKAYIETEEFLNISSGSNFDKKALFEHWLITLRKVMRGESL